MRGRFGALLVLTAAVAASASETEGAGGPVVHELPGFASAAWKPFSFGSIDRHTRFYAMGGDPAEGPDPEGGRIWLRADSECGASARILPLADVDLAAMPMLHWRWRVDEALEIEDERSKPGDDFAARVYVMFRFEPEGASLLARLRHRLGARAYDLEPPGSALSLVWSSREPEGASWRSPYGEESAMLVVASGATRETGTWYSESVDVAAAYRSAFGAAPPALLALGVMTDADDSCGRARAGFGGFRFSSSP